MRIALAPGYPETIDLAGPGVRVAEVAPHQHEHDRTGVLHPLAVWSPDRGYGAQPDLEVERQALRR